ncbi:MAG: GIY-YIG nuclease family protein [Ignavibacteria bacterium]|nr:GIY-YIG nuclease family protein [Ignavibacteria bacterium]
MQEKKYYVYVIQSKTNGRYYVDQTKDLELRLRKHNSGESRSTKFGRPWDVIHKEEFETRGEAVRRERFLKSPDGWNTLKRIKSERGPAVIL